MNFNRWWWLCTFSFGLCSCVDDDEETRGVHRNVPRWLRVFSRGPAAEDEKYEGRSPINHIDNVLKGGTIGVEVDMKKHIGKLDKLWGKVKKYFSRIQQFKKRSRPEPEDRELEGFWPEGLDPRSKWPPSRLVAINDRTTDSEILNLNSRTNDKSDPDSEIFNLNTRPNDKSDPDSEILNLNSRANDKSDPDSEIFNLITRPNDKSDPDSEILNFDSRPEDPGSRWRDMSDPEDDSA